MNLKNKLSVFVCLICFLFFGNLRAQLMLGDYAKKWDVSLSAGNNLLPPFSTKTNFGGQAMIAYNLKWQSHSPGTATVFGQFCAGTSYFSNNTDSALFKYNLLQPGLIHLAARLYVSNKINDDFELFAFGQAGFNSHVRRSSKIKPDSLFEMFDIACGVGARVNKLGTFSVFYQYNYAGVLTDRGYEYYSRIYGATGFYRSIGAQIKLNLLKSTKSFQVNPYLRWQTFYKSFNQNRFVQLGIELSYNWGEE